MFKLNFYEVLVDLGPGQPFVQCRGCTDGTVPDQGQEYVVLTKTEHELLLAQHDPVPPKVFRSNRSPAPLLLDVSTTPDCWL